MVLAQQVLMVLGIKAPCTSDVLDRIWSFSELFGIVARIAARIVPELSELLPELVILHGFDNPKTHWRSLKKTGET